MATPIYATAWGVRRWGGHSGRRWGVVERFGSWFGGGTPLYDGSGQPTPDGDSSIGGRTPAYVAAPPPLLAPQDAATTPQPSSVAIVVPRG